MWPFKLRSRGLTIAWISVVFSNIFNTFVNPIALDAIGWKYYFVFIGVLIIYEISVYFLYPETRGYTLEQMAVIFDKHSTPDNCPAREINQKNGRSEQGEHI